MANIAEILARLEKRIVALERLAGIEPDAATLMHPKSVRQAEFSLAEAIREATELEATTGVSK